MNDEKSEGRRVGSSIFCCDGYMSSGNKGKKMKSTCGVFFTKKTSDTAYFEFERFFNNQKN